jgi:hypothetical protein
VIPQLPTAKSENPGLLGTVVWPLTIIALAFLIAYNSRLGRLLGLVPKFLRKIEGPGGITLEINPEAAKEVQKYFNSSFEELMSQAHYEYNQMAKTYQIRDKLERVIKEGLPHALKANGIHNDPALRATIHVPDIVFGEFLYQLVDYYPISEGRGTAGRRFSQRFGIIGRAWRLKQSVGKGHALPAPPSNATPGQLQEWKNKTTRTLIEEWGMFEEEAVPGSHGRPAYLCVLLRGDKGTYEGVLFIDSVTEQAFGADDVAHRVAADLANNPSCKILAEAVAQTMTPLRLSGPELKVS